MENKTGKKNLSQLGLTRLIYDPGYEIEKNPI
jgi:hypothetical protein